MKLYYSTTSPYSRKALVTAKSLGLGDKIILEIGSSLAEGSTLHTVNPLAKVPTLVADDGRVIFDSPVIIEHLLEVAGAERTGADYFAQLQVQAVADGIMDAAVSTVFENRRADAEVSAYWLERWQNAIIRSIAYAEANYLPALKNWGFGSIGLACALDYLAFRLPELDWKTENQGLAAWHSTVMQKPEMVDTDPRQG